MFTKPGTVYICSQGDDPSVLWNGTRGFVLQTQWTSRTASAFSPASGAVYISSQDQLIISLLDGSIHSFENLRSDPRYSCTSSPHENSMDTDNPSDDTAKLSIRARHISYKAEDIPPDLETACRVGSMILYNNTDTVVWTQQYDLCSLHVHHYN